MRPTFLVAMLLGLAIPASARAAEPGAEPSEPTSPPPAHEILRFGVVGGANVSHPFAAVQVGHRFARADFLEAYLDGSYDAAISEFPFVTVGVGVRTYFARFGRVELLHQALLGAGVSVGGTTQVPKREIGERILGAFVTQGLGADVAIVDRLHAGLTVSTGYPVWLRPELRVSYGF